MDIACHVIIVLSVPTSECQCGDDRLFLRLYGYMIAIRWSALALVPKLSIYILYFHLLYVIIISLNVKDEWVSCQSLADSCFAWMVFKITIILRLNKYISVSLKFWTDTFLTQLTIFGHYRWLLFKHEVSSELISFRANILQSQYPSAELISFRANILQSQYPSEPISFRVNILQS